MNEDKVDKALELLDEMTEKERAEVMKTFHQVYCAECGKKLMLTYYCEDCRKAYPRKRDD